MNFDSQKVGDTLYRGLCARIERVLVTRLEEIEGRVPSNPEIARHSLCGIHPDGRREYKWRGHTILIVVPPQWGAADSGWTFLTDKPVKL